MIIHLPTRNSEGFTLVELMIATSIFSVILLLLTFGLLGIGQNYYKGRNSVRTQDTARRIMDEISQAIQFSAEPPSPIITVGTPPNEVQYVLGRGNLVESVSEPTPGTVVHPPSEGLSHDYSKYDPQKWTIQDYFCIGNTRYVFGNKRVRPVRGSEPEQHGLVVDTPSSGCNNPGASLKGALASGRRELLAENTRLTDLKILKSGSDYTITLQVTTGEDIFIEFNTPVNPDDPPFGSCKPGVGKQYCAVARLETTVHRRRNN